MIKGRKLAQKIVDSCVHAEKLGQESASRSQETVHWTGHQPNNLSTVDLFGPCEVKEVVRKKVKLKVWGRPRPALKELYLFLDQLGKSELENEASKHGTEWSWKIHPADSPHRNGAAEAAVCAVKRALQKLGGEGIFTWSEFQTFLFMAANLAIDARVQSREDCIDYIPNFLLLGWTD